MLEHSWGSTLLNTIGNNCKKFTGNIFQANMLGKIFNKLQTK